MADNPATLALLSGKGGSGKTVIALTMSRVLAEAGLSVLLVDADMSTHGATYFLENELGESPVKPLSLMDLRTSGPRIADADAERLLLSSAGFRFLPSTTNPAATMGMSGDDAEWIKDVAESLRSLGKKFDVVIYDCQAGFTWLTEALADQSDKQLIVLEPDAVSSAAVRVLFLQLPRALSSKGSFQVFNKLTEEERPVYEKISSGTLFPSLPPIPFDWEVRASFAVVQIPSLTNQPSAFSLGVLRLLRTLFPRQAPQLDALERRTVGNWFDEISEKLEELYSQRSKIARHALDQRRRQRLVQSRAIAMMATFFGLLITTGSLLARVGGDSSIAAVRNISKVLQQSGAEVGTAMFGALLVFTTVFWYRSNVRDVRSEREKDLAQESVAAIEHEMRRYETLIATDPLLREYQRRRGRAHNVAR